MALVRAILAKHVPPATRVWVFGSRVNGTARRYSDLDLALEAEGPLDLDVMGSLAEAVSESDLPFKVDLLDLKSVDPAFRAIIQPDLTPFPL